MWDVRTDSSIESSNIVSKIFLSFSEKNSLMHIARLIKVFLVFKSQVVKVLVTNSIIIVNFRSLNSLTFKISLLFDYPISKAFGLFPLLIKRDSL
jgi:hypothetical protein